MCVCVCVSREHPLDSLTHIGLCILNVQYLSTTQFVTRSWGMTADMRAQLLRNLGFLVVKCDNRYVNE